MVGMGGSGFLHPDFLEAALASPGGLIDAAFTAEAEGRPAFLNRKQVADANRAADLRLVNFFGTPHGIDANHPGALEILGSFPEAWNFYHRGFALREIWMEHVIPFMIEITSRLGMRVYRERTLPSGAPSKLSVMTREEALESTPSWPGSAMISPQPSLRIYRSGADSFWNSRCSTTPTAKLPLRCTSPPRRSRKDGARFTQKVSQIEAALLPPELNGSDQRRALLQSLRNNLQELRPY